MLADGFYKVEFRGPLPGAGGIVTIEGGTVRGGDGQFLYAGKLSMPSEGRLEGVVRVLACAPNAGSVFGPATNFALNLKGNVVGVGMFQASGPADLPGSPNITISGTKIASLDLA
jgi:hypothetical protein